MFDIESVTRRWATSKTSDSARSMVSATSPVAVKASSEISPATRDEPAQQGQLLDDPGVAAGGGGGRGAGLQGDEQRRAADGVEQLVAAQDVGDGDGVDRVAPAVERQDGVEDVAVGRLVEVVAGDAGLGGHRDGVAGEQHGPQQRLFGIEVVRAGPGRQRPALPAEGAGHRRRRWDLVEVVVLERAHGRPTPRSIRCGAEEAPANLGLACGHPVERPP